ncbi:hypothetical protein KM043_005162 [Ampulex compressa]|nr:hypothetical protein KM043_005162 [Ampulex compressa]
MIISSPRAYQLTTSGGLSWAHMCSRARKRDRGRKAADRIGAGGDNSHCFMPDAPQASATSKPFGSPWLSSNQGPAVNEPAFGSATYGQEPRQVPWDHYPFT